MVIRHTQLPMSEVGLPVRSGRSSTVRRLKWEDDGLRTLQNLEKTDSIILFTPAVPPLAASNGDGTSHAVASDPFEPLGRAIASLHGRTPHVPFVPQVGMTVSQLARDLR